MSTPAETAAQAAKDYTRDLLAREKPAITYLLYYPAMRDVAREHGYALAIHGSLNRDCDLVAVPWTEEASTPEALVAAICAEVQLIDTCRGATDKPHGRLCWTLKGVAGVPHGWVDLSVIPPSRSLSQETSAPLLRDAVHRQMALVSSLYPRLPREAAVQVREGWEAIGRAMEATQETSAEGEDDTMPGKEGAR